VGEQKSQNAVLEHWEAIMPQRFSNLKESHANHYSFQMWIDIKRAGSRSENRSRV
jgi:hypothetical protein